MKTEFPRAYLIAAAILSAKQDVRYYLNGVLVESLPNETRLAATDGSVAGVLRHLITNEDRFEVIIPSAVVAMASKFPHTVLSLTCTNGQWSLGGIPFTPVDGRFPDYRRVIPTYATGEAGNFDFELLMLFKKVGKALGLRGNPLLRQNGAGGGLIHFYAFDNFTGVVMGLRMFTEKMPDLGTPTWAAERT